MAPAFHAALSNGVWVFIYIIFLSIVFLPEPLNVGRKEVYSFSVHTRITVSPLSAPQFFLLSLYYPLTLSLSCNTRSTHIPALSPAVTEDSITRLIVFLSLWETTTPTENTFQMLQLLSPMTYWQWDLLLNHFRYIAPLVISAIDNKCHFKQLSKTVCLGAHSLTSASTFPLHLVYYPIFSKALDSLGSPFHWRLLVFVVHHILFFLISLVLQLISLEHF